MKLSLSRRQLFGYCSVAVAALLSGCGFRDQQPRTEGPLLSQTDTNSTRTETRTDESDTLINIREFGAVPNDGTDDTEAIQNALDSATEGDTVYVPAGTYHVSAPDPSVGNAKALVLDRATHPNDLAIVGDGAASEIKLRGDHSKDHFLWLVKVRDGWTELTFRDLKLNGNKNAQSAKDGGAGLFISTANVGHTNEILIDNCWVVDANQNNLVVWYVNGVTVRNVTCTGAGSDHGIAYQGAEDSGSQRGEFKRCYLANNNIYGIDCSHGNVLVEDCVIEGNGWGSKSTSECTSATYRRVRFENNARFGYQKTPIEKDGEPTHVTFENCIANKNGYAGFRFGQDTDYEVGTIVAIGNNVAGESIGNIEMRDNARITAGEIRSFGAADGFGLYVGTSVSGNVDLYQHVGNPRGALGGEMRSLSIRREISGYVGTVTSPVEDPNRNQSAAVSTFSAEDVVINETQLLDVPSADEVGASPRSVRGVSPNS